MTVIKYLKWVLRQLHLTLIWSMNGSEMYNRLLDISNSLASTSCYKKSLLLQEVSDSLDLIYLKSNDDKRCMPLFDNCKTYFVGPAVKSILQEEKHVKEILQSLYNVQGKETLSDINIDEINTLIRGNRYWIGDLFHQRGFLSFTLLKTTKNLPLGIKHIKSYNCGLISITRKNSYYKGIFLSKNKELVRKRTSIIECIQSILQYLK